MSSSREATAVSSVADTAAPCAAPALRPPPPAALEAYDVIEPLGKGSFGTVSKIRRRSDGRVMVWKEMAYGLMREKEKQLVVSEVNILRELRHPMIVRYYDRIIDKSAAKVRGRVQKGGVCAGWWPPLIPS